MMEDGQKWYPIDVHVYKDHIQDAVDASICLDFMSCLTPVSGPVIGKMVKTLLNIHNKITQICDRVDCIMLMHFPTVMWHEASIT